MRPAGGRPPSPRRPRWRWEIPRPAGDRGPGRRCCSRTTGRRRRVGATRASAWARRRRRTEPGASSAGPRRRPGASGRRRPRARASWPGCRPCAAWRRWSPGLGLRRGGRRGSRRVLRQVCAPVSEPERADPVGLGPASLSRGGKDGDDAPAAALLEVDRTRGTRVDRVVLADADTVAGLELGAALTDDDLAAGHGLAGEDLHAKALGVGVAAVTGGAEALLMCHLSRFLSS